MSEPVQTDVVQVLARSAAKTTSAPGSLLSTW
jgi:hypothetical protein